MPEETTDLQQLCEILHVGTHRPRLVYTMQDPKVEAHGFDLSKSKVTSKPSWKLIPLLMEAELDAVDNDVLKALAAHTVRFRSREFAENKLGDESFQVKNLYLVPLMAVENLLGILSELDTRLKEVVRSWTSDRQRLEAAIREKVGDNSVFELVRKYIPSAGTLQDSTGITAVSFPLASGTNAVTATNNRLFLQAARQRTRTMLTQVTENLFSEPRQELATAIASLQSLIERDGRVTSKSVAPLRRAFDKLKMFDFAADPVLRQHMQELETKLDGVTPSEQNLNSSTSNGLLAILKTVSESARSEVAVKNQIARNMRRVSV